jgi:O-antigen/teichoic acid export membrane protein
MTAVQCAIGAFRSITGMFSRIARNTGWNMAGNVIPLLVAAAATPWLVRSLGLERFGLLSLIWSLIGYFSLFDLGLGRAITQLVARHQTERVSLAGICSTGMVLVGAVGVLGGVLAAFLAMTVDLPHLLGFQRELGGEFTWALLAVATGVPVAACTAGARGILEGLHRFRTLNLIRVPAGVLLFLVPCAVSLYTLRLDLIAAALVIARMLILVVHWRACVPLLELNWALATRAWSMRLLRFGGWITLGNVVGPVLMYSDRLIISAAGSAMLLAYYAPSLEAVTRLLVIPLALTSALLPALAGMADDLERAVRVQRRALRVTAVGAAALCLAGMLLSGPGLRGWLGDDFAAQAAGPTRILLVGLFFQCLSQIPMTVLYSQGKTRPVALLSLAQVVWYLPAVYLATASAGLYGAAAIWSLRLIVECLVLFVVQRLLWRRSAPDPGASLQA